MKKAVLILMVVFIVLELLVLLGAPKAQAFYESAGSTTQPVSPNFEPLPYRCSNIDEAVNALKVVQCDLKEAPFDTCGHKQAALAAADRAVSELNAAQNCAGCK